jgi:GNAT superfamily N-acetyltransferase
MAIELRLCEPVHVPVLLRVLDAWGAFAGAFDEEQPTRALLELTRDGMQGGMWLVQHRGETVGYAAVERLPSRGFIWQEASLAALYLVPGARGQGVGRVVRRVLGELLAGQGCALLVEPRIHEDRHWLRLVVPAAHTVSAA